MPELAALRRSPEEPLADDLEGVLGRAYLDLTELLEVGHLEEQLAAVHEEICVALSRLPVTYTGGSHRSMGIMPPGFEDTAAGDYGEVLRALDAEQREIFRSLADVPIPEGAELDVGEERSISLSRRQMLWLKHRHGVYFPWQIFYELVPNLYWNEKSDFESKSFTREAKAFFPRTIALVQQLPLVGIGRCNVMGLDPFHHGTLHRDATPAPGRLPDPFLTLYPAPNKRLYLWRPKRRERCFVEGRVVWFNDADHHGVAEDPWFRYSVRVDGPFTERFRARLAEAYAEVEQA